MGIKAARAASDCQTTNSLKARDTTQSVHVECPLPWAAHWSTEQRGSPLGFHMTLTSDSHPYMEVTGNPSANKHPSTTPSAHQVGCPLVGSPFPGTRPAGPSGKVLLAYQSATQHLSSSGLKAGMGLLKMATSQWKHQEKKARVTLSSSSGCRQLNTSGGHPCKKSPLDQLTALVLQGQTRLR